MMLVTHFRPDVDTMSEWLAELWQGEPFAGVRLISWIYLDTEPRSMLVIWEAEDDEARGRIERSFASGGTISSTTASDATPGLLAAWERDLDAFGRWLRARGTAEEDIAPQLELRRLGLESDSAEGARRAARAWLEGRRS